MKALLCIPLLFGSFAMADEATDRIAISNAIAALNEPSPPFTAKGDGRAAFEQLREADPRAFHIAATPAVSAPEPDRPTVTISHEPWGEASLGIPRAFGSRALLFVNSDVALAEGFCTFEDAAGAMQSRRLLFVMAREGGFWKIASLRVLGPPVPR
jgi:hypothetical protein